MALSYNQRMILTGIGAGVLVGLVVGSIGAWLGLSAGVRGGLTGALTVVALGYMSNRMRGNRDSSPESQR